jgi:glycosyltransferase involved in cell wall biosynthesis
MRRLIILPPHNLWPAWTDPPDPSEPDREEMFRLLFARGYSYRRIDPFGFPWNPFAKAHPLLCALDPIRALRVLLFYRHTDIVLCYFESSALLILLLRRVFLFAGKVVVYDVGVGGSWRLRDFILRLVVPRADLLLPLGHNQVAGLLAMGARPGTIHPVLDATSTEYFHEVEDRPDGYVLAVGDDISRDYATLLWASTGLPREVIIRTRQIFEDKQAIPNVTVMRSRMVTGDYRELIAGAVFVVLPLHPSTRAGGITTLLEAMSSGKAVIVTESPGLADYLQDGKTCRVVRPSDPDALRRAIDDLLADAPARRKLGANARRFVVENCSAAPDAARFADVLDQVSYSPPNGHS